MKSFCLMCYQLSVKSAYQEENGDPCFGFCESKKIYKYSPYHNCADPRLATNFEAYLKWARNTARGMKAIADRIEEERSDFESSITHEKRSEGPK